MSSPSLRRRFPLFRFLIGAFFVAATASVIVTAKVVPELLELEHWTTDWRVALLADRLVARHPRIAIVVINEDTLREFHKLNPDEPQTRVPSNRRLIASLVKAVDAAKPKVIGIEGYFVRPSVRTNDGNDRDKELVDAINGATAEVVMGATDEREVTDRNLLSFQDSFLGRVGKREVGFVHIRRESDGVVRYSPKPDANSRYQEAFASTLARKNGQAMPTGSERIAWLGTPYAGGGTFLTIPAHQLMPGLGRSIVPVSDLQDRVVLIGVDYPDVDQYRTPLWKLTRTPMPGVLVRAHMVAQLIDGSRPIFDLDPSRVQPLLIGIAIVGMMLGFLLHESRLVNYVGWGAATIALVLVDALVFLQWRTNLPLMLSLVAWVAGLFAGRFLNPAIVWSYRRMRETVAK